MAHFEFKRLNRTIIIYRVVQTLLLILLAYSAYLFQVSFAMQGAPEKFFGSVKLTVLIQLLMTYPIYRLAVRDAGVEIEGSAVGLSAEALTSLRKKRLLGDLWKFCAVGFFLVFVVLSPGVEKASGASQSVLASTLFSFLLMCLTYFQCFNFSVKRLMKQN